MKQKIVCMLRLTEAEKNLFREAAGENEIIFTKDSTPEYKSVIPVDEELVKDADVLMGWLPSDLVPKAVHLKWLQAQSSGVDNFTAPGVLPAGAMLTSATGAYGLSVAEHTFGVILAIMKNLPGYRDQQNDHNWSDLGPVLSPKGLDILILGTGDLGSKFACYCKAFDAHTIGVRQDPSKPAAGIDEMHGMEDLDELVAQADVVCSLLPHIESMVRYFDYDRLMSMKKNAIFINAGRGSICDNAALARVLAEGHLWGAGLDTTEKEPMPADHPLWAEPKAFITPHVAGGDHLEDTLRKIAVIGLENLKHYLAGEPLRNRKV